MKNWFGAVIYLSLQSLMGCQDCKDCEGYIGEPTVDILLVNGDSLNGVSSDLMIKEAEFDSLEAEIDTLNTSLTFWRDSLEIVEDSISNGGDLASEQVGIKTQITADSIIERMLSSEQSSVELTINSLDSLAVLISSGLVLLDRIENRINGHYVIFEDSVDMVPVALNYNDTTTELRFSFYNDEYDLDLSHHNEEKVNLDGEWIISISNIIVRTYTFDTVTVSCNNCNPGETTITCYY